MVVEALHNEHELLERVAAGDAVAYQQLFNHYWGRVYSVALLFAKVPEVAEDAAQEVFTQLWVKRHLLSGISEFRSYLYRAARNHILNTLRARVFTGDLNAYLQEYFSDSASDPAAQLELKQAAGVIEAAIQSLSPHQQKVFRLSREQGLTHAQIAAQTGLSPRTVKNYMISALQSLRSYLDEHSGAPVIFLWIMLYL